MLEKFLNEYVSIIAGSGAEKIVNVLFKKKNVNEFLIAKKLNMTINQTRNILYKLADKGLVHFMRKKDTKSGGWYTYFWTLDEHKSLNNYRDALSKEVGQQEDLLSTRKTKQFYVCNTCGIEVSDEQALLNEFTCTECGEVYSLKDSEQGVKEIEKLITKLKDKLQQVQIEIDKLDHTKNAKAARAEKKEQKEKKDKKALAAKIKRSAKKKAKPSPLKKRPSKKNISKKKKK